MSSLASWINRIPDKTLAALLRGLVTVMDDDQLTLVWHSQFHKEAGTKRESDIRAHLGGLKTKPINHVTLEEQGKADPMLGEALRLGARVRDAG
jgi:hypothetical protein